MKYLTSLFVLLIPFLLFSQGKLIHWQDCNQPTVYEIKYRAPAPCSIENPGAIEGILYVIQVGVYSTPIKSFPNVYCIPVEGKYYYYLINHQYTDYREARDVAIQLQKEGIFCDAVAVRFPFAGVKSFT
jgi:hypothetical protein